MSSSCSFPEKNLLPIAQRSTTLTYIPKREAIKIAGDSGWFLYVVSENGPTCCGCFDLAKIKFTALEKVELTKTYAGRLPFEDGKICLHDQVIVWNKGKPDHKHLRLSQSNSPTGDPASSQLEYKFTAYPQGMHLIDRTHAALISTHFRITTALLKRFNEGEIPPSASPLLKNAKVLVITGANAMKNTSFLGHSPSLEVLVMTGAHQLEEISLHQKNDVKVKKRIVKKKIKSRGLPQLNTLILTGAHCLKELPLQLLPALKTVSITGAEQFKKAD